MSNINFTNNSDIQKAASLLRAGRLVAFPTETVYGLGADATNPTAIAKIFTVKGRPADHPVIVHLNSVEQITDWAQEVSETAWILAKNFWPGPLTLILPKHSQVSTLLTGGQNTIGLRIPNHPVAQALLKVFGQGIAAPSANRFGQISPTSAAHVQEDLGDAVDYILSGSDCTVGIESTIVDVSTPQVRILRPGAITASAISNVLNIPVNYNGGTIRAPGMLLKHYSPKANLRILPAALIDSTLKKLLSENLNIVVLARHSTDFEHPQLQWHSMPLGPAEYAHELYAALHQADAQNPSIILVEAVPEDENWIAINDRLQKAAA